MYFNKFPMTSVFHVLDKMEKKRPS